MEGTKPNKQANSGDPFDDDQCNDSADLNPNRSPGNEDIPPASLRRRRPLSSNDSGKDFKPCVSFKSHLKKLMETDKDKNGSLKDIDKSNTMQIDASSVDEENEEISTVTDSDNAIIGNSYSEDDSIITDAKNDGVENSEVVASHLREGDHSYTKVDSITMDAKNNDGVENSEVVASHLRESDDSSLNILFDVANLVIKAVGFQVNMLIAFVSLMIKFFTFPLWLIYSWYMFVIDPFQIMRCVRLYVMHKFMGTFGFVFNKTLNLVSEWFKEHKAVWKLGLKFGWGCLWSLYVCIVLLGLLVSAFIMGGIFMRIMVEEPIRMNEPLNFDYTTKSPVAVVPIIKSPGVTCGADSKDQKEVGMVDGIRVIPPNHRLQATVSLTLPESDYNRNLGIFQVRVDFLTANGKVLASSWRPCMLQFRSHPIRLLSTFLKAAPLVTGFASESQKLKVDLKGFSEGLVPTACLRVIIEQRAEFRPGGGIPEMYDASLTLESELPFLKRILWYWKTTLFVWVSMTLFTVELLFALLCCKPLTIPRLRLRHNSNNLTGSQNNPPIER